MKNCNAILTEKLQKYQHYHQVKLISMNIFTSKEILPSDQSTIIEQAKFTYSPLSKLFKKQIKTVEYQGIKQAEDIKSIEGIFPKDIRTNEIKNEIYEIKKWEEKINKKI